MAAKKEKKGLGTGLDVLFYRVPIQLCPDGIGNISGLHMGMVKFLTDPNHFRQRYSTAKLFHNAILTAFKCHLSSLSCNQYIS